MTLERAKIVVEIAKVATSVLLALAVLYLVQVPGTILNQNKTEEDIRRERSRLIIQAIEIDDDARRALALSAIEIAYAEQEDQFFTLLSDLIDVQEQVASAATNSAAREPGEKSAVVPPASDPDPVIGTVGGAGDAGGATGGTGPVEQPTAPDPDGSSSLHDCAMAVQRINTLSAELDALRGSANAELRGTDTPDAKTGPIFQSLLRSAEAIEGQIATERSRLSTVCS
ncbi:MAG: hypothetical protein AAFQ66_10390 [Pseudomonadota bacterium]